MKKTVVLTLALLSLIAFTTGCDEPEGDVTFTLLQTTDVHHRASGAGPSRTFSPVDGVDSSATSDKTLGGYSRLTAKINKIRKENAKKCQSTVLVDSGDFLMGTVYDMTLGDAPAAFAFMQAIKYDAITLGNHEFDFGAQGLAGIMEKALGSEGDDFTIPVIASNMITDQITGTSDDGIEALVENDIIKKVFIKTLPSGLKIGFIGIMGYDAEIKAPLAKPVTFKNNMNNPEDIEFIQGVVNKLRDIEKVHIVIALSHSGVSDTNPDDPRGDDIEMAKKITGIDIIASGHDHATTDSAIEVANATNTTYVICAGHFGKKLAELEVNFTFGTGITGVNLSNHVIDDSVEGNKLMQSMVDFFDQSLDGVLIAYGLAVNKLIGGTDSDNIGKPHGAVESGMGNLVSDSLRYTLNGYVAAGMIDTPTVGLVASGVIRNGFVQGQEISFADLYSVLPLGMTLDPAQQNIPGYPLVKVYLTGAEIKNLCQLVSYVMAADDASFVASLPALSTGYAQAAQDAGNLSTALNAEYPNNLGAYNAYVLPAAGSSPADEAIEYFNQVKSMGGDDTAACLAAAQVYSAASEKAQQAAALCSEQGLQMVLPMLGSDYLINMSGVQFATAGSAGLHQIIPGSVKMYANTDISCSMEPEPVVDDVYYPCVVDIYAVLMMKDPLFTTMLSGLGIPIVPTNDDGSVVVEQANLLDFRIDADTFTEGIQEVKEWQAFLNFVTKPASEDGLQSFIPDALYGIDATTTGYSNRVTQF